MSEKRLDAKNRWRNVVVAFRMSPEQAQELTEGGKVDTATGEIFTAEEIEASMK